MPKVFTSSLFDNWLLTLRDRQAKVRILARIERLALGNPGDVKSVGGGISEMRMTYGPGYRVYFMQRGDALIVILAGGDKSSQVDDIEKAKSVAHHWEQT